MTRVTGLAGIAVAVAAVCSISGATPRAQAQDASIASIKGVHDMVKGYVLKAAAAVPQDKYTYQPTKDVRTMGQLFGHIANASRMICSAGSGMPAGQAPDAEKLATKAEVEKALADAMAFCDHAFQMLTASNMNESVDLFGMKHTRLGAMAFNNAHNFEHYGNIVTYMRMNGMVPPSSMRGGND
jgi:uncharacterized damage-inducible protein DinB